MVAEELSQDEIDSLLGGNEEESNGINPQANKVFELLNTAIEEVFKTAFSLEVVSKFTGLVTASKDDIGLEDKVIVEVAINGQDKSTTSFIIIDKRFASILADLMLMGPGEAKDELEPDDLDALKELFSQVFGQLNTSVKDEIATPVSFEVKEVKQEPVELADELYKASYDVALPNIEDGIIDVVSDKASMDEIFEKEETEEEQEETEEQEAEEVPFKDVEEIGPEKPKQKVEISSEAKNLDLIMDIDLEVKIRIGEKYMLIKDILDLKDGSIIELDKSIEEPMDILVNGKVVAKGVVVVVGGRFGVKITHIETREERIKSLGG